MQLISPLTLALGATNYLFQAAYQAVENFQEFHLPPIAGARVVADTDLGRVRGTRHLARGFQPFSFFRGIPYAEPPVGFLRFEPPVPHRAWRGVRSAVRFGPLCWQINPATRTPMGQENCLFLNVATRRTFTRGNLPRSGFWPVIVYIHGGLFMFGGANIFLPKYFLQENVVLVTLNYRLNSFGFLNTGDGTISGNMGLKDQVMALQWIQNNIRYFNGDPLRVTILGESGGGVCAHLHTMSPMSKNLFARAISLSGTALEPWSIIEDPKGQALEMGKVLGCPTNDTKSMAKCLKSLPSWDVIRYHSRYIIDRSEGLNTMFGPSVEYNSGKPAFLLEKPLELLLQGKISDKPWITGVNSGDGVVYFVPILRNDHLTSLLNQNWYYYAPILLAYENHPRKDEISTDIWNWYLKNRSISLDNCKDAVDMLSDRAFFMANHKAALLQSKVAPTYAYYYTYEGLYSMQSLLFTKTKFGSNSLKTEIKLVVGAIEQWTRANVFQRKPELKLGVSHGDEVAMLFNVPVLRRPITRFDRDYKFSRKMVRLITSFVTKGVPDPSWAGERIVWKTVRESNPTLNPNIPLRRLELNQKFRLVDEPFFERMQFWTNRSIY